MRSDMKGYSSFAGAIIGWMVCRNFAPLQVNPHVKPVITVRAACVKECVPGRLVPIATVMLPRQCEFVKLI